jgi:hypothetical protein
MSLKMMTLAWKLPLNSTETLVLIALADAANDEGFCFPGYENLIEKTKLARATLAKTIAILERAGLFKKTTRAVIGFGRKSNTYQLLFNEGWFEVIKQPPPKSPRLELIESIRSELIEKINNLRNEQKRTISSALELRKVQRANSISSTREHEPSVLTISSEPSLKDNAPSKKTTTKKIEQTVDEILEEFGIDGQLAEDFKTHRKLRRASITVTTMKGFQREADKANIPIVDAITHCIERGWSGFKADWYSNKNQNQRVTQQLKSTPQYIPPEQRSSNAFVIESTAERIL